MLLLHYVWSEETNEAQQKKGISVDHPDPIHKRDVSHLLYYVNKSVSIQNNI